MLSEIPHRYEFKFLINLRISVFPAKNSKSFKLINILKRYQY